MFDSTLATERRKPYHSLSALSTESRSIFLKNLARRFKPPKEVPMEPENIEIVRVPTQTDGLIADLQEIRAELQRANGVPQSIVMHQPFGQPPEFVDLEATDDADLGARRLMKAVRQVTGEPEPPEPTTISGSFSFAMEHAAMDKMRQAMARKIDQDILDQMVKLKMFDPGPKILIKDPL